MTPRSYISALLETEIHGKHMRARTITIRTKKQNVILLHHNIFIPPSCTKTHNVYAIRSIMRGS